MPWLHYIVREGNEPSDMLSQRRPNPALDTLTTALARLDSGDLEHRAMLMDLQELHQLCAEKAQDAKVEHEHAYTHESRASEIIANNYPYFLGLRTKLKNPGRREKIKGVDSWGEWIGKYFSWCSRRTVYRAFRRIEQRVDLLRGLPERTGGGKDAPYVPSQKEVKLLIKSAPVGTRIAEILLSQKPDLRMAKELAEKYLQIRPSTTLEDKFFPPPEIRRDSSDGFYPENYHETFPFYPALSIHPTMGAAGIWFCRPEQRLAGLFWGGYPRSFLKRPLSLFRARRVLHCPSGTLENLPPGHVTLDLVRDDLRRPMVVGDVHHLPFAAESFDLILCDRPYTAKDAEKYGTPMVSMARFMPEAWRVLKPNGCLGILDLVTFPVCRRSKWRLRGIIGVVPWSNMRFRTFSILQKPSEFPHEEASEQDGCEEPSRSFAVLQKTA